MNIRKMTIDDYDVIYELWLSCKGMGLNDVDDSRTGIEKYLQRNPDTCFIAETDGHITGTIMAGHDGRRGFIYHTAVAPSHQQHGIGTALVNAALSALRDEGIAKVSLVVFTHNTSGNAFWEKQGFTARTDLTYRNKSLVNFTRIDT